MNAQPSLFGLPTKIHRKPASLDERFRLWVFANPQVVELFLRFAREAKLAGNKKFGIKAIAERCRWEHLVVRKEGAPWAINNSYMSRLARLLVQRDPSLEGMFEFRRLLSK
jgi:hypothetical protein